MNVTPISIKFLRLFLLFWRLRERGIIFYEPHMNIVRAEQYYMLFCNRMFPLLFTRSLSPQRIQYFWMQGLNSKCNFWNIKIVILASPSRLFLGCSPWNRDIILYYFPTLLPWLWNLVYYKCNTNLLFLTQRTMSCINSVESNEPIS